MQWYLKRKVYCNRCKNFIIFRVKFLKVFFSRVNIREIPFVARWSTSSSAVTKFFDIKTIKARAAWQRDTVTRAAGRERGRKRDYFPPPTDSLDLVAGVTKKKQFVRVPLRSEYKLVFVFFCSKLSATRKGCCNKSETSKSGEVHKNKI